MEAIFALPVVDRWHQLLRAFGRKLLQAICDEYALVVTDRRTLDAYVDVILASEIPMFKVLCFLSRDELKQICGQIGVNAIGTEKVVLAKRISRSISTRAVPGSGAPRWQELDDDVEQDEAEAPPQKMDGPSRQIPLQQPGHNAPRPEAKMASSEPALPARHRVPKLRSLRKLLEKALPTDYDVHAFILDNFGETHKKLTPTMPKTAKINVLFECIDPQEILGNLLVQFPQLNDESEIEYEEPNHY